LGSRKILNRLLNRWGLVVDRSTPAVLHAKARLQIDLDFLIRCEIARRGGAFSFVQIGANDGISRPDDIITYAREFETTGVMVEPQPDIFKTLENNYSDHPGIMLVNKAIHCEKTTMTLYRFGVDLLPQRSDLPLWATTNGMASFNRQHVLDHALSLRLGADVIEELTVECISVEELLPHCDPSPVLLKIDAEGYDYEILNALNLDRFKPSIIRFENLHMTRQRYRSIIDILSAADYQFLANTIDTTAYSPAGRHRHRPAICP
jgi:FkbM family methyltransferase